MWGYVAATLSVTPGDVIAGMADGREEQFLVVATAARKRGLKVTVLDRRQGVRGVLLDDFDATPRHVGRIEIPEDFSTWNPADVKTATNYVNAALADVLAGKAVAQAVTRAYGCSVKYSDG